MGEYYDSNSKILYEGTHIEKYCIDYQNKSNDINEQNKIVESILLNLQNIKWDNMYYTGKVFNKNGKNNYK